ncbi:MAG: hypothetical protein Q7S60_00075, partial [bacterium]|nr:hypothetical protein [bacterium]
MNKFWRWYRDNYRLNLAIAAGLFSLQVIHLFWLFTHVILPKFGFSDSIFHFALLNWLLILVDYTEIPAIISVSLVYIDQIRRKSALKP